jgi:hypothetical protein
MSDKRTPVALDPKRFWDIIAFCCPPEANEEEWHAALVEQVARLPREDIIGFKIRFWLLLNAAYTRDLWRAAALLQGMCSDDGFTYFRCWLVAQGKVAYENALANPDSLADIVSEEDSCESELLMSVAAAAWVQSGLAEEDLREAAKGVDLGFGKLQGEDWDFGDQEEVRRRFPRLAKRTLDGEEGA